MREPCGSDVRPRACPSQAQARRERGSPGGLRPQAGEKPERWQDQDRGVGKHASRPFRPRRAEAAREPESWGALRPPNLARDETCWPDSSKWLVWCVWCVVCGVWCGVVLCGGCDVGVVWYGGLVQVFRERVPELELFSCFLREIYDTSVLLFYLHARSTATLERPLDVQLCSVYCTLYSIAPSSILQALSAFQFTENALLCYKIQQTCAPRCKTRSAKLQFCSCSC